MTSLDGINGRSIQTLLRGENDSKQSDEIQATCIKGQGRVVSNCTMGLFWETIFDPITNEKTIASSKIIL